MDSRDPACTPMQRVATARRLGRSRFALRRLNLQWHIELCRLTHGLPDAALLTLILAYLGAAPAL